MALRPFVAALGLAMALPGCGGPSPVAKPAAPLDPDEAAALAAPLLTDPDLAAMSRRYELLAFPEPIEPSPSPSAPR